MSQVPSLMDFEVIRHFETACEIFLLQGLTVDPYTNITSIRVTVMAQTLGNSIYGNENQQSIGALLPETKQEAQERSFTITTQQEVALEYELEMDDAYLNNMEVRIKNLVAAQSGFLLDLLAVAEDSYFDNVTSVQLFEKENTNDSYFDQFGEPDDADVEVETSDSAPQGFSQWGTFGLIAVFVVAGLAVLLASLTIVSVMKSKCCRKPSQEQQSISTGHSCAGKPTMSVASIEQTHSDAKDLGVYTSEESEEVDEEASGSFDPSNDADDLSTLSRTLPSVPSRGEIQPIYSEDKVHNPAMLVNLREKREHATEKLQSTMTQYCAPSSGGDLASIADSCPDTSRERNLAVQSKPVSGSEMQNVKRLDIENQIERLKRQRQAIEQRIKVKCHKLSQLNTTNDSNDRLGAQSAGDRRGIEWIESVERQLRLDGDGISAMTGRRSLEESKLNFAQ